MAYWLSLQKEIKDEIAREEPYATWLDEFYTQLEGKKVKTRLALPRPVLIKGDDKKYRWRNLGEAAKAMQRDPQHLTAWLSAEMSNSGLLLAPDGSSLCFPKRIGEDDLGKLLRSYLTIYVLCPKCKSGPTNLTKVPSLRKTLMACVTCGDLGAMPPILQGFHATSRGERRRERNK